MSAGGCLGAAFAPSPWLKVHCPHQYGRLERRILRAQHHRLYEAFEWRGRSSVCSLDVIELLGCAVGVMFQQKAVFRPLINEATAHQNMNTSVAETIASRIIRRIPAKCTVLSSTDGSIVCVAQSFLQSMAVAGVTAGYAPNLNTNSSVRGQVFFGCTKDLLREFAKDNDVTWSIQDEKMTLIPQTNYIPGEPVLLTANTGMISIPEQTQNGISVRCLLNPNIKIGQTVRIEGTINQFRLDTASLAGVTNANIQRSNQLNGQGLYYVMYAQHTGDTRGNPWYTDLV